MAEAARTGKAYQTPPTRALRTPREGRGDEARRQVSPTACWPIEAGAPVASLMRAPKGYAAWIADVNARVRAAQMREHDAPSIGLLLCKTRSRVFAEYALRDTTKPMGIAEYQLVQALPRRLEASLPSIEQIEAELAEPATKPQRATKRRKK